MTVRRAGNSSHVARARIGGVFTDGHDLVIIDDRTNELLRVAMDGVLLAGLRRALERFDLPWQGTSHPHEHEFTTWVDGDDSLDPRAHDLLRARQRPGRQTTRRCRRCYRRAPRPRHRRARPQRRPAAPGHPRTASSWAAGLARSSTGRTHRSSCTE